MPKEKLTADLCRLLYCDPRKTKEEFFDTETKGFTLEVRASGTKTFYLRYTDPHSKQRQIKIGRYGDITFDQARKKARELKSQAVLGGDPAAAKATAKAVITYAELAEQHLADAKTYQKSYATTRMYMRNHIKPRWGKHRLTDIKPQDITLWLAEKRKEGLAPSTVEKLRVLMNRSYELALQWRLPGAEINPVRAVPRGKFNNARDRFLTAQEAERLFAAARQSNNKQLEPIIRLLLLTGARRNELLYAKWENVDVERRHWLIPDSKTGKPRHVPLAAAALAVIEALPRFDGCPWLLPNPETGRPYTNIKSAFQNAREAAGMPELRIHDLRHSAASFMVNAGVDLFAVGRVLGHADHKSTMRYSHLANDTLLAAVEAGAAKMAAGA